MLYPSLAENFVERWIKDEVFKEGKDWKAIKSIYRFEELRDFKKYCKLYELFDLYYVRRIRYFVLMLKLGARLREIACPKRRWIKPKTS